MNEINPAPKPNDASGLPSDPPEYKAAPAPNPLPPIPPETEGPGLALCIILGVVLCIVSTALCFVFPPSIVVGLALAGASLFFRGYRGICLGYVLTVGVALLGTILWCSTQFRMN